MKMWTWLIMLTPAEEMPRPLQNMIVLEMRLSGPCPHDSCWHSWKNATQIHSDDRADYV